MIASISYFIMGYKWLYSNSINFFSFIIWDTSVEKIFLHKLFGYSGI